MIYRLQKILLKSQFLLKLMMSFHEFSFIIIETSKFATLRALLMQI